MWAPMVVAEGRKVGVAHYGVLMVVVEVKKVVAVESLVEQVVNQVLLFLLSFLHISFPIVLGLLFLITKGWVSGTVILYLPSQLLVVVVVWYLGR